MKNKLNIIKSLIILISIGMSSSGSFNISRIHYSGGGDWYSNASSLPNLLEFIDKNTLMTVNKKENQVKIPKTLRYSF